MYFLSFLHLFRSALSASGTFQKCTNKSYMFSFRVISLPLWLSWSRIRLQCGRTGFYPWVGKIPRRRERLPTPVFWLGEFHGLKSPWGRRVRHDLATFLSLHRSLHDAMVVWWGGSLNCILFSQYTSWNSLSLSFPSVYLSLMLTFHS